MNAEVLTSASVVKIGPAWFYDDSKTFPKGLKKRQVIAVEEGEDGWYRILGTKLWVHGKYLKLLPQSSSSRC